MREEAGTPPSTLAPEGVRPRAPLGVLLELPDDIPIAIWVLRHSRSVGRPCLPQACPRPAVYGVGALSADGVGGCTFPKGGPASSPPPGAALGARDLFRERPSSRPRLALRSRGRIRSR